MAIPALRKRIVRCWVDLNSTDSLVDVIAGGVPRAYNNASWELQVAFGYGPEQLGQLADVSDLNTLLALIWLSSTDYLSIQADYIDPALTLEEWTARSSVRPGVEKAAHAVFTFTEADFSFELGTADVLNLKLTLHGDTTDEPGEADAWKKSDFQVIDAGLDSEEGTRQAANIIPNGATYDGAGHYTLNGLTVGRGYRWTQGGNDTSVTNGAETVNTSNAVFFAQAVSVTLNGAAGQPVTAVVWYPATMTADEMVAFLQAYGGTVFNFLWLKASNTADYYKVNIAVVNGVPMLSVDENSGTPTP